MATGPSGIRDGKPGTDGSCSRVIRECALFQWQFDDPVPQALLRWEFEGSF
jgi:hypothetical protein